jgi:hypothetical protein
MKKSLLSPTPWTVAPYKTFASGAHVILSPPAKHGEYNPHPVIASVTRRKGYKNNAYLIAAAPELFTACDMAARIFGKHPDCADNKEVVAIKKAAQDSGDDTATYVVRCLYAALRKATQF